MTTMCINVTENLMVFCRKDVRLPQQLQRAMAAEAEAAREARAKVIAAEGEHKSSRALAHAAEVIAQSPAALQVFAKRPTLSLSLTLYISNRIIYVTSATHACSLFLLCTIHI